MLEGCRRVYDAKDACEYVLKGFREGYDEETICQNLVRQSHDEEKITLTGGQ